MKSGVKVVKTNVKEVLAATSGDRLGRAVMVGALIFEAEVKGLMQSASPSGRMYGSHRASAPGEPPAIDTAAYINSIQTQLAESTATTATAESGTDEILGIWLEYGTRKMAARPHFRPSFDKTVEQIKAAISKTVKGNITVVLKR